MKKGKYFLIFAVVILSIIFLATMAHADWKIKGTVFNDKDCDLVKQAGEKGVKGATVNIVGPKFPFPGKNEITPGDGKYEFNTDHKPGSYTITVTPPSGWCVISPNPVTVNMVKHDINNVNFGASKIGVSPPSGCCP